MEPSVSFYISNDFTEQGFDVQEEFIISIEKYNRLRKKEFNEARKNEKVVNKKKKPKNSKISFNQLYYWVKIPIINNYQNNSFEMPFNFYFKSKNPNCFWEKRGTYLTFETI